MSFPDYYILVGRTPMAVDVLTWGKALQARTPENDPWRIARTEINDRCYVSTVFLGLNHRFSEGEPVLFETMIFGGPLDREQRRYETYTQAEDGHEDMVTRARIACARIDAIMRTTHENP